MSRLYKILWVILILWVGLLIAGDSYGQGGRIVFKSYVDSADGLRLNKSDTSSMLTAYRGAINTLTANSGAGKVAYTDTAAMLSAYRAALNSGTLTDAQKVAYTDTSTMLSAYRTALLARLLKSDTTTFLTAYQNAINARATVTALNLKANTASPTFTGTVVTPVLTANTQINSNNYYNTTSLNNSALYLGTLGATIQTNVANTNTALKVNKVLGTGLILDVQNNGTPRFSVDMTGAITGNGFSDTIAKTVLKADTASMLTPYRNGLNDIRSQATAAINVKLNLSDTASMLASYRNGLNSGVTANALKVNIADTAAMLAAYTRVTRFLDSVRIIKDTLTAMKARIAAAAGSGGTFYVDSNSVTGDGTSVNPLAVKNQYAKRVLAVTTSKSFTGTTTETEVYRDTIKVSRNPFGLNTSLHIPFLVSASQNTNTKTFRIKIQGVTLSQLTLNSAALGLSRWYLWLSNRNSLTTQIIGGNTTQNTNTGWAVAVASAPTTLSLNTASDVIVTVTVQLANAADAVALEQMDVIQYP